MPSTTLDVDGWTVRFTDRDDGDFAPASVGVVNRRAAIVGSRPVVWLRQVHGAAVVIIPGPDEVDRFVGIESDAAVTASPGVVLSVVTADCAPIAIVAGNVGAVAHAGWQGLLGGVIEATVDAVRGLVGASAPLQAVLGPCIHAHAYEFGDDDLCRLSARYGNDVRGQSADGHPALDIPRAVGAALGAMQVPVSLAWCADTSLPGHFSHRSRTDPERQALFLWRDR